MAALEQAVADVETIPLQTPIHKQGRDCAANSHCMFRQAPFTQVRSSGELRARRRLLPSNKQSRALSVSRVEKTIMLYIAGYQETWMLLRSSFSKKNQPERDCEDFMD
ncbi:MULTISPECIES: hypothetical protein [unclassified Mesorhizobium]|uniref:hypothetical protein n=1 Tax=unclassified Mesorhizobium TaxID=325217 RepID=UPI00142ED55A|nr:MULTISPECIES: hypothetical protein [unclassified Mesorhizobium]